MLKGIDVRQRIEFVSSQDSGEPKTVFVLRPLSSLEKTIFSTMQDKDQEAAFNFYLQKGIAEVRNYDTEDVKEAIAMLDPVTLGEIIGAINGMTFVSKSEAKNS